MANNDKVLELYRLNSETVVHSLLSSPSPVVRLGRSQLQNHSRGSSFSQRALRCKPILLHCKGVSKKKNQALEGDWIVPPALEQPRARKPSGLEQSFLSARAEGFRTCCVPNFMFNLGSWDILKALRVFIMALPMCKLGAVLAL